MSDQGETQAKDKPPDIPAKGMKQERRHWVGSSERRKAQIRLFLGLAAVYLGGGVAVLLLLTGHPDALTVAAEIAAGGIALGGYVYALLGYVNARARFRSAQEAKARTTVDAAFETLKDDLTLGNLLSVNRTAMEAYQTIARGQAEDSYNYAKVAAIVGLVVLIVGACFAIFRDDTTTKVVAAVLASLGGTLSVFISKTFLTIYQRASAQMSWYFEQPLVSSYLLNAERLTEKIKSTSRDETYRRLIDGVLSVAASSAVDRPIASEHRARAQTMRKEPAAQTTPTVTLSLNDPEAPTRRSRTRRT